MTGFKYAFAFFGTSSLTAEKLHNLMWDAIACLKIANFKILCIVGDGAATNRKCFAISCGKDNFKRRNLVAFEKRPFVHF